MYLYTSYCKLRQELVRPHGGPAVCSTVVAVADCRAASSLLPRRRPSLAAVIVVLIVVVGRCLPDIVSRRVVVVDRRRGRRLVRCRRRPGLV
jgi:hypothetical protein